MMNTPIHDSGPSAGQREGSTQPPAGGFLDTLHTQVSMLTAGLVAPLATVFSPLVSEHLPREKAALRAGESDASVILSEKIFTATECGDFAKSWADRTARIREFLDANALLYQHVMAAEGIATYAFAGNVIGVGQSEKVVHDTVGRFVNTLLMPVTAYRAEQPDDLALEQKIAAVNGIHKKYGVLTAENAPRENIGTELFQYIYATLFFTPWLRMDEALRREHGEGMSPATLHSAIAHGIAIAPRLHVESFEGMSVNDIRDWTAKYSEEHRIKEEDRSLIHRKAIEFAFVGMEIVMHVLPSDFLSSYFEKYHPRAGGMRFLQQANPAAVATGSHVFDVIRGIFGLHPDEKIQDASLKEFLTHIDDPIEDTLMIGSIVKAIRAGQTFEEFAANNLQDFQKS